MKTLVKHIAAMITKNTARLALTASIAGTAAVSTTQAHEKERIDVRVGVREVVRPVVVRPVVEVVRPVVERRWVEAVFEDRQTKVWVEPVYQTVPGEKVFVEPAYRTVVDRVWREPIVREEKVSVLIPATWTERDVIEHHRKIRVERVLVPAHYEIQCQKTIVTPGRFEEVARQELVTPGHWECGPDRQILVTAGHFEVRCERVCVTPAHWETPVCVR